MPRRIVPSGLAVFAALALGASACTPPPPAAQTDSNAAPRIDLPRLERLVHERANEARRSEGRGTLAWSDSMATVARRHSEDMARRTFFDHRNPDGLDPTQRARTAGLRCEIVEGRTVWRGFAENLYYTQHFASGSTTTYNDGRTLTVYQWKPADVLASESVRQWMNSPGHRANLLQPRSRRSGVGIALGPDSRIYFTQLFC